MGRRIGLDAIGYLTDTVIAPAEAEVGDLPGKVPQIRAWRTSRRKGEEEWDEDAQLTALVTAIERKQRETDLLVSELREKLRGKKA